MKKPGARSFRRAIRECSGIVADVAAYFNVTRQTIYNWRDHYQMHEEFTRARQDARSLCVDVFYERVMHIDEDKRWEAAQFGLRHLRDDGEFSNIPRELLQVLMLLQARGGDLHAVAGHLQEFVEAAENGG
jgi:hypothetical protein